jgi:hypothetical protein
MSKVRVSDCDGTWIDAFTGEVMTTVWTSEGWKDLPGEYEVHDEFLPVDPKDDDLSLTIVLERDDEIRFLNVVGADFEEVVS